MGRAQGMRSRWWRWRYLNERRTQCEIRGNRVLDDPLTLWEYVLCSDPNVAASQKRRNGRQHARAGRGMTCFNVAASQKRRNGVACQLAAATSVTVLNSSGWHYSTFL